MLREQWQTWSRRPKASCYNNPSNTLNKPLKMFGAAERESLGEAIANASLPIMQQFTNMPVRREPPAQLNNVHKSQHNDMSADNYGM
mmetsp:Transcript_47310/g.86896  ORF Transcript_47310/g.86896 Transcript_47310/m.86896 type:complete len:87 (+) Transcript_47310:927-1187(+)